MIFKANLDRKITLLYPQQVPESHIPGDYVSTLVVLVHVLLSLVTLIGLFFLLSLLI